MRGMTKCVVRRFIAVSLALALAMGLCACGKKASVEDIYTAALEKQNELTDMNVKIEEKASMSYSGETVDINMNMDCKVHDAKSEDMAMDLSMEMSSMGTTLEIQMYYADGYCLMEMMGQKMKYPMSADEAMEEGGTVGLFDVSKLSELKAEEGQGGDTKLTFTVDTSKLTDEDALVGQVKEMLETSGLSGSSLSYTAANGSMTVNKDGYISAMDMHLDCTMDIDGESIDMTMDITVTYDNPGAAVEVEIPDASEYTEIDPSLLG